MFRQPKKDELMTEIARGTRGMHFPRSNDPKSFAFRPDYHVKAHEGIHATVTKIANHYGVNHDDVYSQLNTFIHWEDKHALSKVLAANGYKQDTHLREYIPWIHTILHDKNARNKFLDKNYPITHENEPISWHDMIPEAGGEENQPNVRTGRQAIQRLGRTWRAIQSFAREANPTTLPDFSNQARAAAYKKYKAKKS